MGKYNDIVDYLIGEISNEKIKFEHKMPSIRSLSEQFQCSKSTVVRAYEELQKKHIVYSIPQSGYFLVRKSNSNEDLNTSIINLASAAPDESVLPYEDFQHCLNQAIDTYKYTLFNYSNTSGLPSLISVLVKHLQEYQVFCHSNNIVITAGAQQAIDILCNMRFPNGKTNILVEQPVYRGLLESVELSNATVLGIERGLQGINLDELERKFATGNIKCYYTVSRFHNPLGISYSIEEKKQIVKLAEKYDVYIIEDDYLADLDIKNNSYPMYYYDTASRVIYIKSFSKVLLPGLRIGAAVLPNVLVDAFKNNKKWADLGTAVLSQGALELYIKSGMFKAHQKKIKQIYAQKMQLLQKLTGAVNIPDVKWHIPDTGFFACIEFLTNINSDSVIKKLNEQNILINHVNENYLMEYYNDNLLKISLSKASVDDINTSISIILDVLLKVK